MDKITAGCYIVAVSGGVDSMALLDMLRHDPNLRLVVAHVDHGIRKDSAEDGKLVAQYASTHNLLYESATLHLGPAASEETARRARYNFLQRCCKKYHADGIITAHHQDDLIETALIACIRGTGWRGLAPFVSDSRGSRLLRPLITIPKHQLIGYARKHHVPWREDTTNQDERYMRNHVRLSLMPMLDQKSTTWRTEFLQHIRKQQAQRRTIEAELAAWLKKNVTFTKNTALARRYDFIMLPRDEAYELLQQLFRQLLGNSLERPLAEASLLFLKAAKPGKQMLLNKSWQLRVESANLIVEPRTPVVS